MDLNLVLYPTKKGNFVGTLKDERETRTVFCPRQKEKAKTGATKFAILEIKEDEKPKHVKKLGTLVIGKPNGKIRIGNSEGIIVGRAYINETKIEIAEFKSRKNGKKYLKGILI